MNPFGGQIFGALTPGVIGLSATGTTSPTATQLYAKRTIFTMVVPGGIAKLPNISQIELAVLNRGANSLFILPSQDGQIEQQGVNAPVPVAAGTNTTFVCVDVPTPFAVGRQWWIEPAAPSAPVVGNGLFNAGGALQLTNPILWPTSDVGLFPGSVWNAGGAIFVVPGHVPSPSAARQMYGFINSYQLLGIGGRDLPIIDPVNSGQLWNNSGVVCVSLGL